MKVCFKCRTPITLERVGFREECHVCGSDLHVCVNCLFYDIGKSNFCREDKADYVKEKDRANYCEYFRFADDTGMPQGSDKEKAEELWSKLFKK
jgi:hypothetical protein